MRYHVTHRTSYLYEAPVLSSQHVAHLAPRTLESQSVSSFALRIEPSEIEPTERWDYFGNLSHWFEISEEHRTLTVTASSVVDVFGQSVHHHDTRGGGSWEECRAFLASSSAAIEDREYCLDSPLVRRHPKLAALTQNTFTPGRNLFDAVVAFNQWIEAEFRYDPNATAVSTPLMEVEKRRAGVCQDFAHIAVGGLRSIGLAARYVSGYLETRPPPGTPRLVGADASHAWASVLIPNIGWVDFDPTNGVLPQDRHVTVAWGRDFSDVTPIKGVILGGGPHSITVGVDVQPRPDEALPAPDRTS